MPNSDSWMAYPDVKDAFDKAMTGRGIMLTFKDHRAAHRFVARANSFRLLDRRENKKLFGEHERLYGRSDYDVLRITRTENEVKIERIVLDLDSVTEL